jgi:hypothetical protein
VQEEWKRRNGDKYIYIETNPRCQLTPNKEYELFTDLTDEYLIQPKVISELEREETLLAHEHDLMMLLPLYFVLLCN